MSIDNAYITLDRRILYLKQKLVDWTGRDGTKKFVEDEIAALTVAVEILKKKVVKKSIRRKS